MKLSSILVSVDLGPAGADRVQLAAGLAAAHEARLVGVAAARFPSPCRRATESWPSASTTPRTNGLASGLAAAEALFEREAGPWPSAPGAAA